MGYTSVAVYSLLDASGRLTDGNEAWRKAQNAKAPDRRPVAFLTSDAVRSEDIEAATMAAADVTIIVADAGAATSGRASADLAAVLWQSFPAVAALLSKSAGNAGAVVFSATGFETATCETTESGDRVTAAIAAVIRHGGTVRAVLMPGDSETPLSTHPAELAPGTPHPFPRWLKTTIQDFDIKKGLGGLNSVPDSVAVRAGLLLWHDDLDASHERSQSIEGEGLNRAGDYWHAIMHRRERDYGNSKYWFRRVGRHPVFESLATRVTRNAKDAGEVVERLASRLVPNGHWDPFAFVDAGQADEGASDAAT
nr:hypothetical protein [Planctomycetota bacterium]